MNEVPLYCKDGQIIKAHAFGQEIDLGVTVRAGTVDDTDRLQEVAYWVLPAPGVITDTPLRLSHSVEYFEPGSEEKLRVYVDNHSGTSFRVNPLECLFRAIRCSPVPHYYDKENEYIEEYDDEGAENAEQEQIYASVNKVASHYESPGRTECA